MFSCNIHTFTFIVQSLSCEWLFVIQWTAAHQASLSFTISRSLFKVMSIESVMPSNQFILCHCFTSCLQSFPASGSFPMSWLFASGDQSIGAAASASVLLMNIQGWFPLGLTSLFSLQTKGLSRVFSRTTVSKHQFFGVQPSLWSNSYIHTWLLDKTISLTIQNFVGNIDFNIGLNFSLFCHMQQKPIWQS